MKMIAKVDTDAYGITFGAKPFRTPIKKGDALYFTFVQVVNDSFTIVQSGANLYVATTQDFEAPEAR